MKLSVYTLVCPEFTLEEAAAAIAALGVEGIEWRVGRVAENTRCDLRDPERFWSANRGATLPIDDLENAAREAARITSDNGLTVSFLAGWADPSDAEAVRLQMAAAQILGAPAIRVGPGGGDADDVNALFDAGRQSWDEVEELARSMSVKAVVEIHHEGLIPSASAARRFIEGRDPDCCGVLYDPGNMAFEGYERPEYALQVIRPWLAHVHVKNARPHIVGADEHRFLQWSYSSCSLREGIVDWPGQVAALREAGYDGWLSLEDFNPATQAAQKLSEFADLFRALV